MAHQTLDELKADNTEAEELEAETTQVDVDETDDEVVDVETDEVDEAGELDESDAEETETEDWMKGDTDDDNDDGATSSATFDDSDMAKTRRKYKGKLAEKDEENERLRAENEALKSGKGVPQKLAKPNRDNFEDDDAFHEAMVDYKIEVKDASRKAEQAHTTQQTQRQEKARETADAVDKHYERAVTLATESGITPEMYQNADFRVRNMVNSLFPDAGDAITDALIANLGEGSEKVMFSIGVKDSRLKELHTLFQQDPTGVKASMYLGTLKAELNAPRKRKTNAPKPAPDINGDAQKDETSRKLKKRYDEADKKGDLQSRFNTRREAKKAGVDTSNW